MRCLLALLLLLVGCVDRIPDRDRDGFATEDGDCDDLDATRNPDQPEVCNELDDDCDEAIDEVDADGDGSPGCGEDCNDDSADQYPGHEEVCDAVDNDCNGTVDDGFDVDGDGVTSCLGDCRDDLPEVYPGAQELCDGEDNDCDDFIDEDFDQDGDGVRTCDTPPDCDDTNASVYPGAQELCDGLDHDCNGVAGSADQDGDGWAACQGDCNDQAGFIHPGADEVCDEADNNCNGVTDEGFDNDSDGVTSCGGDCDDLDAGIFPGNPEVCDGADQDCDEQVDEDFDLDNDGFTTCSLPVPDCDDTDFTVRPDANEVCDGVDNQCDGVVDEGFDLDGDGWAPCVGDCDDTNPAVSPGAFELCNGSDDNCNGVVDEGYDNDNDNYSTCTGDCDDSEPSVNPDGTEVCDGLDNNCDLAVDEPFDADGDTATTCGPDGLPGTSDDDCNDSIATVFPGALEVCDGLDSNCDGFLPPVETDSDADTIPSCQAICEPEDTSPLCVGDCDDNDADNWPGNTEVCDAGDNDCDGVPDEGFDLDLDGVTTCGADGAFSTADDDCDDADPLNAGPFAEACDGADNDCDGVVDNGYDLDGDGVTTCAGDCDDNDPTAYPGAAQTCTAVDNDCDGVAGDLDDDGDGSLICEDCDDNDPLVYPGAGFSVCDGTDHDCDGQPETEIIVAFLPGQISSWASLPALQDLVVDAPTYGGCSLSFVDLATVTEAALLATGAHVAWISSPGENCTTYDANSRDELGDWLAGEGRGLLITGTLGTDGCAPYSERTDLAALVGVTLSSADPATAVAPLVQKTGVVFWTGIGGFSFNTSGSTQGDELLSLCSVTTAPALVGDPLAGAPRQVVAYEANPAAPCLSAGPLDHRGAWLPFQPEEGGNATDRLFLFNVLDWLKDG